MKGYKAFEKGLVCKGKQYAENTIFEKENAKVCECGMHFCENPLDVLDYYPLIDDNGELTEYAEVEALDEVFTDDNKKYCTKKLKIGAKLDLPAFVKASIDFQFEKTPIKKTIKKAKAPVEIPRSLPPVEITRSLPPVEITRSLPPVDITRSLPPVDITRSLPPVEIPQLL